MAKVHNIGKQAARNRRLNARKRKTRALNKVQRVQVKAIVEGQAEKKNAYFYESFNDGTSTARSTGAYVNRGWCTQNQSIRTNNTDIKQLIPYVDLGDDVNQRIGRKIDPTNLVLAGAVRVALARQQVENSPCINFKVHLFIVQHVQIKDYYTLYGQNDFTQFLYNGEGQTVRFDGEEQNAAMAVNSSVYKVLKKKVITLKYAGNQSGIGAQGIPNSHVWKANYSINLTKYLPSKLMYPLNTTLGPLPPAQAANPTNSSLFMCMAFCPDNNPANTNGAVFASVPWIEQTYVTRMSYTDS